jgi:hypothetical protein
MESTFRVTKGWYGWDNWYFRAVRRKTGRTVFNIDWKRGEGFEFRLGKFSFYR